MYTKGGLVLLVVVALVFVLRGLAEEERAGGLVDGQDHVQAREHVLDASHAPPENRQRTDYRQRSGKVCVSARATPEKG